MFYSVFIRRSEVIKNRLPSGVLYQVYLYLYGALVNMYLS